jgi:hypothetical protein
MSRQVGVEGAFMGRRPGGVWRRWTVDEEARLRQLVGEGLRAEEIGRRLGRTVSAVWERSQLMGLRLRKPPSARRLDRT